MSSKNNKSAQQDLITRQFTPKENAIVEEILSTRLKEEYTNNAKDAVKVLFKAVTEGDFTLNDLKTCFDGLDKTVLEVKVPAMKQNEIMPSKPRTTSDDVTILQAISSVVGDKTVEELVAIWKRDAGTVRYWIKKAISGGLAKEIGKRGRNIVYRFTKKEDQAPTQAPAN